jgi:hypothetical protein
MEYSGVADAANSAHGRAAQMMASSNRRMSVPLMTGPPARE